MPPLVNKNPKSWWREFTWVLGGYALLIAIGYLPVVFLGRTLDPAIYVETGTTRSPSVLPGRRPVSTADVDIGTPANYEWPINRLVGRMWASGQAPLWNPYQGMGAPLAAQYSTRAFFPYQILEDLCPVQWSDVFLLGRIFFAAAFTWLFLRRAGASSGAAFLGGALYAFSGTWSWLGNLEQLANVALMLPVLLWTLERLGDDLRPREVALAACAIGLTLVAGQPETALYVFALAGVRTLHKLWPERKNHTLVLRRLAALAGALVLGLLLASPLLAIFWTNMQKAFHLHHAGGLMGVQSPTPLSSLAAIWTPALYGHPAVSVRWPDNGDWDYLGGFSGILVWVLIIAGLARTRFRGALGLFAGAAFFILLKNLGLWPAVWIGHLPLFDQAWTPRWAGPVWTLSLAAAGAFAVDVLIVPRKQSMLDWRVKAGAGMVLLSFIAYVYWVHFCRSIFVAPAISTNRDQYALLQEPHEWIRDALGCSVTALTALAALLVLRSERPPRARVAALLVLALSELWFAMPRSYDVAWSAATIILFFCGLGTAWALLRERPRVAVGLGCMGILSLGVIDGCAARGWPARADAYQDTPGIAFLQTHAGLDRIMATDGVLPANAASAVGLFDVRYIYALAPKLLHIYNVELMSPPRSLYHLLWFTGMRENAGPPFTDDVRQRLRAYSLAGVRYLVTPKNAAAWPGLPKVYDGEVAIYENPNRVPRARIVHQAVYVKTVDEALTDLRDTTIEAKNTAVLYSEPLALGRPSPGSPASRAAITSYGAREVVIDAALAAPGVLVLTDVFDSDWTVTVDGQRTPMFPADLTFRGVALTAGRHTVVFSYDPPAFSNGKGAAAVGLAICLALWAFDQRRKRGASGMV